jgi:hypothetical protein
MLKDRLAATAKKLDEIKVARKAADKERRSTYKQSKADKDRKISLVGEAVIRRVESGEWDEAEFRKMMDEALSRPVDRALFDLD